MMEQTKPKVSIIIPYFNRWDLTHARLYELYKHAPLWCEIILINDSSTEIDCERGVVWWQELPGMHNVRYKKTQENLGFGGSMNLGAKLAHGEILVLLSNDVKVYGDFITPIVSILEQQPTSLVCGSIVNWAAGWNEFDLDGRHIIMPYGNGWLLSSVKSLWEKSGGFDPRYGKFDYEDVDISTWFVLNGYDIIPLNSNLVEHNHQGSTIQTLNVDRLAHTQHNREVYIDKWRDALISYSQGLFNGRKQ